MKNIFYLLAILIFVGAGCLNTEFNDETFDDDVVYEDSADSSDVDEDLVDSVDSYDSVDEDESDDDNSEGFVDEHSARAGFRVYTGEYFSVEYPERLAVSETNSDTRHVVEFVDVDSAEGTIAMTVVIMPNMAGDTTLTRVENLMSSGVRHSIGERVIDGNVSEVLMMDETEAGPLYVFVTEGGMSYIYEIQTVGLSNEVLDTVISSFNVL